MIGAADRPRPALGYGLVLVAAAPFGINGSVAKVLAIHRLAIGIALLIQYLGPLLVAMWARVVRHESVRSRVWVALGLALARGGDDRRLGLAAGDALDRSARGSRNRPRRDRPGPDGAVAQAW